MTGTGNTASPSGFTLLEMVVVMGMIGLLTVSGISQRQSLWSLTRPLEKMELLQGVRFSQVRAIASGQPQRLSLAGKTITLGPTGLPQPGSSGTYALRTRSGQPMTLILSSMGRSRIQ